MTYYVTKPATDSLKDYINANYETYLALIRTASGYHELDRLTSVDVGNDYTQKGKLKPFMLIDPVNSTPDDGGIGCLETIISFDIIIAVEYTDSEKVTEYSMCYADAFVSMFLTDDTLGDTVEHASVIDIAYYSGGTGTIKYVLLNVELTINTDRS